MLNGRKTELNNSGMEDKSEPRKQQNDLRENRTQQNNEAPEEMRTQQTTCVPACACVRLCAFILRQEYSALPMLLFYALYCCTVTINTTAAVIASSAQLISR